MYPVSEAYKKAIKQKIRTVRITGGIILKDGTKIELTDEDTLDKPYIKEQCVSGGDIDIGSVFATEFGIYLKTEIENPYSLEGARIIPQFGIKVDNSLWSSVPLGYFYITDIKRRAKGVSLTALDGMIMLDADLTGVSTSGLPQLIVSSICARCGVTLATTTEEFNRFANSAVTFTLPEKSKVETCRDLLMWVCQATATFARFNREGQLELISVTGRSSVRNISINERYKTEISDNYVKITQVDTEKGESKYSEGTEGMTMSLEQNPLFEDKTDAEINFLLSSILSKVTLAEYTPCNSDFIGDPALQAGDYVGVQVNMRGANLLKNSKIVDLESTEEITKEVIKEKDRPFLRIKPVNLGHMSLHSSISTSDITKDLFGQAVVFSFKARSSIPITSTVQCFLEAGKTKSVIREDYAISLTTDWQTYFIKIPSFPFNISGYNLLRYSPVTINVPDEIIEAFYLDVCEYKIEFGEKVTPWMPAVNEIYPAADENGIIPVYITNSTWKFRGSHKIQAVGRSALLKSRYSQQSKSTSAVKKSLEKTNEVALAANQSAQLIKDAIGGSVLKRENELLIMDNPDPEQAVKIWRFNIAGLGYSDNVPGADNPDREYKLAITMDGMIQGSFLAADSVLSSAISQAYKNEVKDEINNKTVEVEQSLNAANGQLQSVISKTADDLESEINERKAEISEIKQTADSLNLKFTDQYTGGINCIHNSSGLNGLAGWENTSSVESVQNTDTKNTTISNSCFRLNGGSSLKQTVENVVSGKSYTLTLLCKKTSATYPAYIKLIHDGIETDVMNSSDAWEWQEFSVTVDNVVNEIVLEIATYYGISQLYIADIMLVEGDTKARWTPAPDEIYTTGVKIDRSGIEVSNSESDTKTVINNTEFSVYHGKEKAITVNKDETHLKKSFVNADLTIGKLKFLPKENRSEGLDIILLD